MNVRKKIALIVTLTIVVIAGLFVLRNYYGDKFGIFADRLTDEKILATKSVVSGDFDSYQQTNLVKEDGNLQIKNSNASQTCGNYPSTIDTSGISENAKASLEMYEVQPETPYVPTNFDKDYMVGNTQYISNKTQFNLVPADPDSDLLGFSIKRGNGWLKFELNPAVKEGEIGTPDKRNAVHGKIVLPAGFSVNAASLVYDESSSGIENQGDDKHDLSSTNDEIVLSQSDPREVEFFLATYNSLDTFALNYCFTPSTGIEGSVSGQIDLGEIKPISSLRLEMNNWIAAKDSALVSASVSKDGQNWISGPQRDTRRYNFQGSNPLDSYCFRYIKFTITLKSDNRTTSPLGLKKMDIYGGDHCGSEIPFNPGNVDGDMACSNGIDDDGDGKTDFSASGGDPGCTDLMDDSEQNPISMCKDGSNEGAQLTINITGQTYSNIAEIKKHEIWVGGSNTPINSGEPIQLIADGVAIKDSAIAQDVVGLAVYRGEGYFFIKNQSVGLEQKAAQGNFTITGPAITKVSNYHFDNPNDGIAEMGNSEQDEYSIKSGEKTGTFTTTVRNGIDGIYVYYQYTPKTGGACQCQDKKDNDNNKFTDFPEDFGCSSAIDNIEAKSTQQLTLYSACKNGLDDDNDGKVDYPDDPGCESAIDNDEKEPAKVCRTGDTTNLSFTVTELSVGSATDPGTKVTEASNATKVKIFTGDGKEHAVGEKIDLIVNGEPVIDSSLADKEGSLLIKRGPGYIYLASKETKGQKRITEVGKLKLNGVKISEVLNGYARLASSSPFFIAGPFEGQGDGATNADKNNDEFSVSKDKTTLSFASMASGGSDSAYIYYDYTHTLAGGCACQDGKDNDGDGLSDMNDKGCADSGDNDETNSIMTLISEPVRILPALITSGTGFVILVIVILLIAGISIYFVLKNDKGKIG
ncbi:MAG: hypothetical protein WC451_02275 [Patescibacteria group bacterium]